MTTRAYFQPPADPRREMLSRQLGGGAEPPGLSGIDPRAGGLSRSLPPTPHVAYNPFEQQMSPPQRIGSVSQAPMPGLPPRHGGMPGRSPSFGGFGDLVGGGGMRSFKPQPQQPPPYAPISSQPVRGKPPGGG